MNPDRLLECLIAGEVEFVIIGGLGSVAGIGAFGAVRRESVELNLGRHVCRVLNLDALFRAKEALGRPHDLQTVVQLKAIRERNRGDADS